MKNIKTLYKENKDKIIFAGCVVGVAVIGALTYKELNTKEVVNPFAGKDVISWIPNDKFMNLGRVKEILDLNANNHESFAIFREGVNSDDYGCILISDNVVTDKPEEA